MLNLLKVDLYKMFRSLTFRIIGIILIAFSALVAWVYAWALSNVTEDDFFALPNLFDGTLISFNNSVGIICLSIIAANFICSEFSNGTFKNVVSKGYSREVVYLSKFIMSAIAIVIYMICMLVTYLIVSVIFLIGSNESIFGISPHFASCFGILLLYVLALIAVSMLFAVLFKKTWVAVLIFVFAPTVLNLIGMITKFEITDYFLTSNIVVLSNTMSGVPSKDFLRVILIPIVYLVISLSAGMYVFEKRDI